MFFRDAQAAIKDQNSDASFGEISKIVANMWTNLAEDQRAVMQFTFSLKYYVCYI